MRLIFCNKDQRDKNCEVAPHRHGCSEMVLYGRNAWGETQIDGRKYGFQSSDIALIRTGVWHNEHHLAATEVIFLGFETTVPVPQGIWSGMAHAEPLFYDIVKEVRNQEWGYEQIISWKLQEILTLIQRRSNGMEGNVKSLTYCRRFIEENYMQRITVGELAGMTCYSPDRFRHLFTEEFGISPQNYLVSVRIKQARELLRTTQLSCLDIAQLCGFSDSGQMTKMVKREYGRTPRELRGEQALTGGEKNTDITN